MFQDFNWKLRPKVCFNHISNTRAMRQQIIMKLRSPLPTIRRNISQKRECPKRPWHNSSVWAKWCCALKCKHVDSAWLKQTDNKSLKACNNKAGNIQRKHCLQASSSTSALSGLFVSIIWRCCQCVCVFLCSKRRVLKARKNFSSLFAAAEGKKIVTNILKTVGKSRKKFLHKNVQIWRAMTSYISTRASSSQILTQAIDYFIFVCIKTSSFAGLYIFSRLIFNRLASKKLPLSRNFLRCS